VNERYTMRLRRRLQYEERKCSNQRKVVKLCCRKDLASLHGEGCITAVPFAHIPVVPREVQTMDGSKYEV